MRLGTLGTELLGDPEHLVCALATTSRSATPVARPTSSLLDGERGTVTVTVPAVLAAVAGARVDVRRDPRVGVLFWDRTGQRPGEVLVQGQARAADGGLLVITPTRVHARPDVVAGVGLPSASRAPAGSWGGAGSAAFRLLTRRIAAVGGAVLAAHDAAGAPWLLRVHPVPHPATGTFLLTVPPGEPVRPGPASLLVQDPGEKPWPGRGAVVGHLADAGGVWVFAPHGNVPGADADPARVLAAARTAGRAARRRLLPGRLLPPAAPGAEPAFTLCRHAAGGRT